MNRHRLIGLFAAGFAILVASGWTAHAQYRQYGYCNSLQAQYRDALRRSRTTGVAGSQQFDKLRQELARAQDAAQRYGCTGGSPFFQRDNTHCGGIMARVVRLSKWISRSNGASTVYAVARLRDALTNAGCNAPSADTKASARRSTSRVTTREPSARDTSGGSRTLCVRFCDGYYFPIEFRARRHRFKIDAAACQSMYAAEGQAELFVQSASRDVTDARSLSGERYGDQPNAFAYQDVYTPACVDQLHAGMSALAGRYYAKVLPHRKIAAAPRGRQPPLPVPQLRKPASEDPETLANAAGHFRLVEPAVALADTPPKHVRMVGPAYYTELFDLTKPRKEHQLLHRPTFSIIGPAAAADLTETPTEPR